jgi:hypothetical protein
MNITLAGRKFSPPGPVAAAFMTDRSHKVCALMGPVGGGKTVTCFHKLIWEATQMPVCLDGTIRFRVLVVRDTYDHLEKTAIATWVQWVPRSPNWKGGGGRTAEDTLRFAVVRDGEEVPVEFHIIFAALGDQAAQDFMRGFEPTALYLNEGDLLSEDVLTYGLSRIGRYPAANMLPPNTQYRDFVLIDLNAPDTDSWFFRRFEEIKPPGHKLYRQPSGRSARAENIKNLKPGYYDGIVSANASKPRFIKRYVDSQYVAADDGDPVWPEYSDEKHLAPELLLPAKGVPIRIGLDNGLRRPAAVFTQWLPNGQWRVLGEVFDGRMGPKTFAARLLVWLQQNAPQNPWGPIYADIAGFEGADKEEGELAWAEQIAIILGVPIQPVENRELDLRLDAVRDELVADVDGQPAFLLSPVCKVLRKAMASHYRYRRMMVNGDARLSNKPDKDNGYSDVPDALQFVVLGSKGRYGVVGADAHAKPGDGRYHDGGGVTIAATDFSVF